MTYVEVLLSVVLIAVCLVPIIDSVGTMLRAVHGVREQATDYLALESKLEQVLREPVTALTAAATAAGSPTVPASYSDIHVTEDGRQLARQVYLALYDADNADGDNDPMTGGDPGIIWVKVVIAESGHGIETLASK